MQEEIDYDPEIIIEGDSFYAKETLDSIILANIMNPKPFMLTPQDSFAKAVRAMADRYIACIPIIDKNGKPVGVLADMDVIGFVAKFLI